MLARVLCVVAGAVGLLLGAVGAVAVPEAAIAGVVLGGLAGVLVGVQWWWLRRDDTPHRDADVDEDAAASGAYEQLPGMRPPPGVAAGLSTEQLCLAWQRSYSTLLDTPAGPARFHVVALRAMTPHIHAADPHPPRAPASTRRRT